MVLRSLAYKTDLAILAFEGVVEDRGPYIVAKSPGNPSYFWGNLLVMHQPPRAGDFAVWTKLFEKEFASDSLIRHMTFGWDSISAERGDSREFVTDGFEVETSIVLTLTHEQARSAKHPCDGLLVRPLLSDADWAAAIKNQVDARLETFKYEPYLQFKEIQMAKYRRMSDAGLGFWVGAFAESRLVGD